MQVKRMACALLITVSSIAPARAQTPPAHSHTSIAAKYGKLPLTFEANHGQIDSRVKFVTRNPGYTAFLTSDGMVLSLRAKEVVTGSATAHSAQSQKTSLHFRLLGAAKNPVVVGDIPQLGRVNYFVGNNPAKWLTNVPTYGRVRYKNIYPGIDLLYYGNQRQLEYDFTVAPGADPGQIRFEIQGSSHIQIDPEGSLVLTTRTGEIHFQPPKVFQGSGGQRVAVDGGYIMVDATHVRFHLARYDSSKPLVIDPVLVYSTYLGGSGDDQPSGIAVDTDGNVYVAGSTDSTDFPLSTIGSMPAGNTHAFVSKLDATGSNLIYTDYLGGSSQDYGYAVALDTSNHVYVSGSTTSSDFPMVNPFQGTYPGGFNAFLTKISSDGSSLLYSTFFGGSGSDVPTGLAVDPAGDMIIAGYTSSLNLPVANAYQSTVSPNMGGLYGNYGFLSKFSSDGASLVYSTYFGGNVNVPFDCGGSPCWPQPDNSIAGLALDTAGNTYVTGGTNTYNFPVTQGAYLDKNTAPQSSSVGFVSKFSGGGELLYSTYFYEASGLVTNISAIAVDSSGSAYVTGLALSDGTFPVTSTSICDPSALLSECNFAFVTKFDPAGTTLLYSTFLGPNNNAVPQGIVLDRNNDAYVLAYTGSGLFSTVNGIEGFSNGNDILLVEIDAQASTQVWATYFGASGNDQSVPGGLAIDASGDLYIAGATDSIDLPVTQSAYQSVLAGNTDAFILKVGTGSAPSVSLTPASLQYATETLGSSTQPQTVLLRNMGSSALSISSITTAGDFAETDSCGNSVPAAGSCSFSVVFTPTASGSRSGSVVATDDAAGSPHIITMDGTGSGASITLTPSNLVFPSIPLGTSSLVKTITLSNIGNAAMAISGVEVTGDYRQSNDCPASLSAGATCGINVTFSPAGTGTRNGMVMISDGVAGSPQSVGLVGTGSDFSIASLASNFTVKAGATATYTMQVAAVGGTFANAVKLSCSGVPAKATCALSSSSVTPGANSATVTLTIATTGTSAGLTSLRPAQNQPAFAVWLQLPGFGLVGLALAGSKPRAKRVFRLIALILLIGATLFMPGCAGGTGVAPQPQQTGTTPGTYTIAVSGTSGALQHSAPVTLTVQ